MITAVIAATGLFTPEQSISNAELVDAYNAYAERFNADHAAEIAEGDVAELTPSSVEFVEKASGIKSRFVLDKAGVLDPARMAPNIPERGNDELSIMAEMAVAADKDTDLATRPLGQLLGQNVARIALKRGAYLRDFVYHFASLLSDRLDKNLILKAMTGHVADYEL